MVTHPPKRAQARKDKTKYSFPSTAHRGVTNDWTATTASDRVLGVSLGSGQGYPASVSPTDWVLVTGTAHHGYGARPTKPLPIARVRVRFLNLILFLLFFFWQFLFLRNVHAKLGRAPPTPSPRRLLAEAVGEQLVGRANLTVLCSVSTH